MLETHELPAGETRIRLIETSLPCEDTDNTIRTRYLDLDIASPLMLDPDSHRHVLQALKIRIIQHVLGDFVRRCHAVCGNERPARSDFRLRILWSFGALDRLIWVILIILVIPSIVDISQTTCLEVLRRSVGKVDCGRVEPCLRFHQIPGTRQIDECTCIDAAVSVCHSQRDTWREG